MNNFAVTDGRMVQSLEVATKLVEAFCEEWYKHADAEGTIAANSEFELALRELRAGVFRHLLVAKVTPLLCTLTFPICTDVLSHTVASAISSFTVAL